MLGSNLPNETLRVGRESKRDANQNWSYDFGRESGSGSAPIREPRGPFALDREPLLSHGRCKGFRFPFDRLAVHGREGLRVNARLDFPPCPETDTHEPSAAEHQAESDQVALSH